MNSTPKIVPLAPGALTVDFGNQISEPLNRAAIELASRIEQHPFQGLIEATPAYASVAVFFDVATVRRHQPDDPTAFDAVKDLLAPLIAKTSSGNDQPKRTVEIPVDFGPDAALDLAFISERSGLSPTDVIETFLARTYRVYMLGFLPGFPYMGEVDERIATPRRDSPRLQVPKGSVGIAGRQTGIYPLESPGGWQIIGRTSVEMFTPMGNSPCLLAPGDEVRFVR